MTTDFDKLQILIDSTNLSNEDKRLIKVSLLTQGKIPEVTSAEQYVAYGKSAITSAQRYLRETAPGSGLPSLNGLDLP